MITYPRYPVAFHTPKISDMENIILIHSQYLYSYYSTYVASNFHSGKGHGGLG